ncbi:hypothetical protein PR048_023865, partial [Dryococelus australis]
MPSTSSKLLLFHKCMAFDIDAITPVVLYIIQGLLFAAWDYIILNLEAIFSSSSPPPPPPPLPPHPFTFASTLDTAIGSIWHINLGVMLVLTVDAACCDPRPTYPETLVAPVGCLAPFLEFTRLVLCLPNHFLHEITIIRATTEGDHHIIRSMPWASIVAMWHSVHRASRQYSQVIVGIFQLLCEACSISSSMRFLSCRTYAQKSQISSCKFLVSAPRCQLFFTMLYLYWLLLLLWELFEYGTLSLWCDFLDSAKLCLHEAGEYAGSRTLAGLHGSNGECAIIFPIKMAVELGADDLIYGNANSSCCCSNSCNVTLSLLKSQARRRRQSALGVGAVGDNGTVRTLRSSGSARLTAAPVTSRQLCSTSRPDRRQLHLQQPVFPFARLKIVHDIARLHHRGSKLNPISDLRSTQKTVAPFEFRAGLEIEMKFISNRRNWRFEISVRAGPSLISAVAFGPCRWPKRWHLGMGACSALVEYLAGAVKVSQFPKFLLDPCSTGGPPGPGIRYLGPQRFFWTESCRTMPLAVDFFFSGISRFIPKLLHTHLTSPSSALKTSLLRAALSVHMNTGNLKGISHINNGYKYIMRTIDVFFKSAFAVHIKDKTAKNVVITLEYILIKRKLDNGSEFYNKIFNELMQKYDINHSSFSKLKSSVERFNFTMKNSIWKRFALNGNYNKLKRIFEKGYTANWSTELFTICNVLNYDYPNEYLVEIVLQTKGDKIYRDSGCAKPSGSRQRDYLSRDGPPSRQSIESGALHYLEYYRLFRMLEASEATSGVCGLRASVDRENGGSEYCTGCRELLSEFVRASKDAWRGAEKSRSGDVCTYPRRDANFSAYASTQSCQPRFPNLLAPPVPPRCTDENLDRRIGRAALADNSHHTCNKSLPLPPPVKDVSVRFVKSSAHIPNIDLPQRNTTVKSHVSNNDER